MANTRFGALHCDSQQAQSALGMVSGCLRIWVSGYLGIWVSGYLGVWVSENGRKGVCHFVQAPTTGKPSQLPNEKVSKEQRPVGTIEARGMQEEMGLPAPVILAYMGSTVPGSSN